MLVGRFGFGTRMAVPLNLLISMITVRAALLGRMILLDPSSLSTHVIEIVTIGTGSIVAARIGAGWLAGMPDNLLERIVALTLLGIAVVLIAEGALPAASAWELTDTIAVRWPPVSSPGS